MNRSNVDVAGLGAPGDDGHLSPRVLVSSTRGDKPNPAVNAAVGLPTNDGTLSPRVLVSNDGGDKTNRGASGTQVTASAPRGWQSKLARRLNLDRRKVNDVLLGKRTNARVAAAIADAVGVPASQLWPGKYQRLEHFEKVARHQATKAQSARHADACAATGSPE
jgi:lambda repressor-like predicted transcriptional regulator